MNIVIVDKKERALSVKNDLLTIDTRKIPLHLIDTLLLVGTQNLRSGDLVRLSAGGVQVVLLSADFSKSALLISTSAKNTELKLAQYRACTTKALPIAKMLLTRKVTLHAEQLLKHQITIETESIRKQIHEATTLDMLLGIEGSLSRSYFGHYFALFPKNLHKGKRSKRPPRDPLNALLSWYYTLFYNLIAVRLIGFGFEPSLGFLHRPFRSHMALASDLLELCRADINEFVYDIFAQQLVTARDFSKKGGVYLRYEGRKKLWQPFRTFAASLEPHIDASITEIRRLL